MLAWIETEFEATLFEEPETAADEAEAEEATDDEAEAEELLELDAMMVLFDGVEM